MSTPSGARPSRFLELLEEAEGTRAVREFKGWWQHAYKLLAATYSLLLILAVLVDDVGTATLRGGFLLAILALVFLRYPATKGAPRDRPSASDLILIVLALLAFGNFIVDYENMAWRAGAATTRDLVLGTIAIALVLEACRRAMSVVLPILALVMLAYALLGQHLPGGVLAHQGYGYAQVIGDSYASTNGIFGFVAYVFIAYVMLFIIMGALFEEFGAGRFFIDLPVALTARFRGGPAKAAVVASGMFGMISGSAVANTVATGTFTIPLIKKMGYRSEVAGAIEAAASTGGMFMPPVMGAGAFLMAEMLKVPYAHIITIAFVPAILYFFSVLMMVHFEAGRAGLGSMPKSLRPAIAAVLRGGWFYLLPLAVLFVTLFEGYTPSFAAFWAIVSFVALMFSRYAMAGQVRRFLPALYTGLANGGEKSLIVGVTAGPVGIIIGIALLTGLAFRFSEIVMAQTHGMVWLALLLVLFATFILGMGITVTADYLILALLAVPALGQLGVPLIAAHFVVFWFSQSSNVTPPVCMSAFAGAGIAGAHPYRTGFHAMKFSSFLYLMPFMFVYTPLLMPNGFDGTVAYAWAMLFLAAIPYGAGVIGFLIAPLAIWERVVLVAAGCAMAFPGHYSDAVGVIVFVAMFGRQWIAFRRTRLHAAP
ncbi:MAG: TRAP transporter fused permease subunit [Burkholderiaceae bacterium]|nr:TRAP transporter fused permease subunit [Burkholderiaceae bacterium]